MPWRPAWILCTLAFGGCASMSGLGGGSSYGCKAPEGVTCDSVSGVYVNAIENNLPSQRPRAMAAAVPESAAAVAAAAADTPALVPARQGIVASAPPQAMPLRSSARILRLWFKPWEDADRDLYDQGYVYVQVDSGQWLLEHAQRQIREAHAPLRPPPGTARGPAQRGEGVQGQRRPESSGPQPSNHDPLAGQTPSTRQPGATD